MKKKNIKYESIIILLLIIIFAYQEYSESIKEEPSINMSSNLTIEFIDVGQADSILISTNNHNMLIDAGNNNDGPLLVNYFNNQNITSFDYIVGTHPHEDHIGGLDDIINNFTINKIYLPKKTTTTKTFTDLLDAIENKNLSISIPKDNEEFNLGEAKIKVIYNGGENSSDINESSIVLKLTYGNNTFLLTGDTTSNIEKTLLDKDLESDLIKIAHHGSNYSTSNTFLNKVNPKYAIISVGKDNDYNHPATTTINKLNNKNIKTYRTDENGTIVVTTDGNNIIIKTKNTNTNG